MINEFKRSFQLMRYGHELKTNLLGGLFFMLVGIFLPWESRPEMRGMIMVYLLLGPMMCLNLSYSLLYTGLGASSPRKREIELMIPDIISVLAALISYLALEIHTYLHIDVIQGSDIPPHLEMIVLSAAIAIWLMMFAVSYKYYFTSFIVFFLLFFVESFVGFMFFHVTEPQISFVGASVISFSIVVLGVVLSGILRRLLYKRKLSPWACGNSLRKAMQ